MNLVTGVQRELFVDPCLPLDDAVATSPSGRWVLTQNTGRLHLIEAVGLTHKRVEAAALPLPRQCMRIVRHRGSAPAMSSRR